MLDKDTYLTTEWSLRWTHGLKNGGMFKAAIEAGQSSYYGSEQNGVTSQSCYAYCFGSYRLSAAQTQSGAAQQHNFTLNYDAAGNVTQKGDLVLSYNDRNRVARAEKTDMQAAYRYNAEGLRSSKTVNSQRTDYIYGMGGALLAWKDNSGWHENIYLDGDIIAVVENGKVYYSETDYQGKALVSKDGLRVYRPPSPKPNSPYATTGTQANFEGKIKAGGRPISNGHLNIVD